MESNYEDPFGAMNAQGLILPARYIQFDALPDNVKEKILGLLIETDSITFDIGDNWGCQPIMDHGIYYNHRILSVSKGISDMAKKLFFRDTPVKIMIYSDADGQDETDALLWNENYSEEWPRLRERHKLPSNFFSEIRDLQFINVASDVNLGQRSWAWEDDVGWFNEDPHSPYPGSVCGEHGSVPKPSFQLQFRVLHQIWMQHGGSRGSPRSLDKLELSFTGLNPDFYNYCRLIREHITSTIADSIDTIKDTMAIIEFLLNGRGLRVVEKLVLRDFPHGIVGQQIYECFEPAMKYVKKCVITDTNGLDLHSVGGKMLPISASDTMYDSTFNLKGLPNELLLDILSYACKSAQSQPRSPGLEDEWPHYETGVLSFPHSNFRRNRIELGWREDVKPSEREYQTCAPMADLSMVCVKWHYFVTDFVYQNTSIVVGDPPVLFNPRFGAPYDGDRADVNPIKWLQTGVRCLNRDLNGNGTPRRKLIKHITIAGKFSEGRRSYPDYPRASLLRRVEEVCDMDLRLKTLEVLFCPTDMPLLRSIITRMRDSWFGTGAQSDEPLFITRELPHTQMCWRWIVDRPVARSRTQSAAWTRPVLPAERVIFQGQIDWYDIEGTKLCSEGPDLECLLWLMLTEVFGKKFKMVWREMQVGRDDYLTIRPHFLANWLPSETIQLMDSLWENDWAKSW